MRIAISTLGCKVNQYESGVIARQLQEQGHEIVRENADLIVVNTCAVTNEAERKSRQLISKLARNNPRAKIAVCGCSAQKNAASFAGDGRLVIGTAGKTTLPGRLSECGEFILPAPPTYEEGGESETERVRSYIKIQDGCDHFCSYCIVPYLRGRSRSRNVENILAEIEKKRADALEFVLTGIDISDFGKGTEKDLTYLIKRLSSADFRVRLGSLEVRAIDERLIDALSEMPNFCDHFHLSLQSGSGGVLKRMNRHYTPEEYFSRVQLIRDRFPSCGLTTDIIAGFPTESDAEHRESLAFCEAVGFSDIHVFSYSKREGTVAAGLKQVESGVKAAREAEFLALKAKLRERFFTESIGKTAEVLVEETENNLAVGYTRNYLRAYIENSGSCENTVVRCKITAKTKDGCIAQKITC